MPREFRIEARRSTVRSMRREDVTEFTRYRNIPDVARFQDWPLPYTRDHAHALLDEMDGLRGPTRDVWVQLAIEVDATLVGDVAVWLDHPGQLATIGYTLAPEHQGRGYASDAVEAVVGHLFRRIGVHRVTATLDPRNLPSARVLERNGFRFVGTARSAALQRGEWLDDARYELLRDDWATWTSRPTHPVERVDLVELHAGNIDAVCSLTPAASQQGFATPVATSIALAAHGAVGSDGDRPWARAIVADGDLAGFVLATLPGPDRPARLAILVVDHRHQRRGIGRHAVTALAEALHSASVRSLEVEVADVPGGPARFFDALGFARTGRRGRPPGSITMGLDLDGPAGV